MRRAPEDNVLPDQFQTVAAVLPSDWCQKIFVYFFYFFKLCSKKSTNPVYKGVQIPPPQLGRGTIAPCKVIQNSLGFWIPCCGLWMPGTRFWIPCQWNVDCGLWIPIARRNSLSWILDSKAQDSGFQSLQAKNFQDSGNPDITFHGAKWDLSTFKLNLVYVVQLIFYLRKFILYWLIFVFGYGNVC